MMARELSRVDQGNGFTVVQVVNDNTTIGQVVVPTNMLDQPGYDAMLDVHVAQHHELLRRREAGGQ